MEYGIKELNKYLHCYFAGNIGKEELGKWAENAYLDLLKGGYIEKRKIVIYPFLKVISRIHIEKSEIKDVYPCSEAEIKEIQAVIDGKKDFCFQVEMAVPAKMKKIFLERTQFDKGKTEIFMELHNKISEYLDNNIQESGEIERDIMRYLNTNKLELQDTLLGSLEEYIIKLSRALFGTNMTSINTSNMALYAGQVKRNLGMHKLLEFIECYIGIKSFNLIVSYKNGLPEILLLV